MRVLYAVVIIWLCSLSNVFADQELSQVPYVTASLGGRYFFLMKSDPNAIWDRAKGTGICYEVTKDGEFKELWRTGGWYSFETFLTSDGRYLVRLGNWPRGSKPSADDVAVAFYKNGVLLKLYSTADLIRNESAVQPSVSHYQFLDEKNRPTLEYQYQTGGWIFKLVTVDGIRYQFDAITGQILAPLSTDAPLAEKNKAQP